MRRLYTRLTIPTLILLSFLPVILSQGSFAYDQQVYNNLLKSRDALLGQKNELQAAYDATQKEIDELNAKLGRIDGYMKQVNSSLKDVDTALLYAKQ